MIYLFCKICIPPNNKIHGRNIRERNNLPGYSGVQRREIQRKIHPRHQNSLQADGNLTIYPFYLVPPSGSKKRGFLKGEAIRLLRTNSSKTTFEECLANYKRRLEARGYPKKYTERSLSEVTFDSRQSALNSKNKKTAVKLLPFVTSYHPAVEKLKQIVMENWSLIENQPLLNTIFKKPPIISYKRNKSLKDMLVSAKL